MADSEEGVAADGTIRTGARRDRVPVAFEPVLADAVACAGDSGASLYVYGSVANGTVRPGVSDVDLLSIGLPDATALGRRLSARYAALCRGVEFAAAAPSDLAADTDEAYGFRVFIRHYCVHLGGPDPAAALPTFPADARAVRGLNGDIGRALRRWRQLSSLDAEQFGVRIARKTLLAVAGLVSVRDRTWTTDRSRAARRWGELEPGLSGQLGLLSSWTSGERHATPEEVALALADDGVVPAVVERFDRLIGLWPDS